MPEQLLTALVSATVALVVSLLTYMAAYRKLQSERQASERLLAQKFAEELLKQRLRLYPKAFLITGRLGIGDPEDRDLRALHQTIREELQSWKAGEVDCIISVRAEDAYYELIRKIKKNPERGECYSKEQISKLYDLRQTFRGALRGDLGLLHEGGSLSLREEDLGLRSSSLRE